MDSKSNLSKSSSPSLPKQDSNDQTEQENTQLVDDDKTESEISSDQAPVKRSTSDEANDQSATQLPSKQMKVNDHVEDTVEQSATTPTSKSLPTMQPTNTSTVPTLGTFPTTTKGSEPSTLPNKLNTIPFQNLMIPNLSSQVLSALPFQLPNKELLQRMGQMFSNPYNLKLSPSLMSPYNSYPLLYYPQYTPGTVYYGPPYDDHTKTVGNHNIPGFPSYTLIQNSNGYNIQGAVNPSKYPSVIYNPNQNKEANILSETLSHLPVSESDIHTSENTASFTNNSANNGYDSNDNKRIDNTIIVCNCKKSRCLKLYCLCFSRNIFCNEHCNCVNCHNSLAYNKEREKVISNILRKDPFAFKTVIGSDGTLVPTRQAGCKCKRTECLKKYCECFAKGVLCTSQCSCVGCKNCQL